MKLEHLLSRRCLHKAFVYSEASESFCWQQSAAISACTYHAMAVMMEPKMAENIGTENAFPIIWPNAVRLTPSGLVSRLPDGPSGTPCNFKSSLWRANLRDN